MTVVCAFTEPWALLAVRVYVVVCDGETWIELPVTAPRPLTESDVALATDQESVALPPPSKGEIDAGEAVNEEIVGTVALLPATAASSVCRGSTCIASCSAGNVCDPRIVCDPKVLALLGRANADLGRCAGHGNRHGADREAKRIQERRGVAAGSGIAVRSGAGALDAALAA